MCVERREAVAVPDQDDVSVAGVMRPIADLRDRAGEGRVHAATSQDGDVQSRMESAPAIAEPRLERPPERDRKGLSGRRVTCEATAWPGELRKGNGSCEESRDAERRDKRATQSARS
jgi:hypothetical protein